MRHTDTAASAGRAGVGCAGRNSTNAKLTGSSADNNLRYAGPTTDTSACAGGARHIGRARVTCSSRAYVGYTRVIRNGRAYVGGTSFCDGCVDAGFDSCAIRNSLTNCASRSGRDGCASRSCAGGRSIGAGGCGGAGGGRGSSGWRGI